MRTLVIISHLDEGFLSIAEGLRERGEEVGVVLLQDAVYLALKNGEYSESMKQAMEKGVEFHIMARDVERRGVTGKILPSIKIIDFDELIDLLFRKHQRVINL